MYIEKKAEISIDLGNIQANSTELGQLIQKNTQGLEEIAVADILNFIAQDVDNQQLSDKVYTLSLSDTAALEDFDKDFFAQAAVSIEGKGVEYSNRTIILTETFEAAKITFAANHSTLELTLENYMKPEKSVVPETEGGFTYRFFSDTVTVADIFAANEIVSSYYNIVSVSDEKLVTIKGDELTAQDYFDEAILTVSLSDGTEVEITLSNPAPVAAGETVVVEGVGSFSAKDEIPAGTVLTVNANPKVPEGIVIPGSTRKSGTVSAPVFFDVSLVGPDGKEIQTGASVTIATDIALPQEDGKVTKVTAVKVYHIDEKGDVEELEGATYALGEGMISSVSFATPGFSLFAIIYTVDFVFAGVQFSMPGGGALLLSDLFEALSIEETVADVLSVTFSNPDYLTVEPYGDDWRLYSHCSFTTPEKLIIGTVNGVIEIDVTDPTVVYGLDAALYVATINGQSEGTITIREDEEFTIHLEFNEVPGSIQFPTDQDTMTYQLPTGLVPGQALTGVPIVLRYTEDNLSHTLTDCTYDLSATGLLTVHLSALAREKLAISGDGVFKVDIVGKYEGPTPPITFDSTHEFDFVVDNSNSVSFSKSGYYDSASNKVKYTVYVDSTGTNHNVVVSDAISGTALTLDTDSIVVKNANGNVNYTINSLNGDGFNLTVPEMANKERLTIEYTASVNWNVIGNGKGTVTETQNGVTVTSNEDPNNDPVTHNLENRISYNPLTKSTGEVIGDDTANTKTIPWTISLNAQQLKDMAGTTITDTIDSGSASIMSYTGQGVTMTIKDGDTVVGVPQLLTWNDLGVDISTDKTWSYTIPAGTPNHYRNCDL